MSEFKPITTQEDFDIAVKERVLREQETLAKKYADYDEVKERNNDLENENTALKSNIEETNKKYENYDNDVSELNAKIAGYETANLRTRIALENGIPYDLASRIVGEDEDSITADAKRLAELVGNRGIVPPLKDVEPNIGDEKDGAYKSLLENLNLEGE